MDKDMVSRMQKITNRAGKLVERLKNLENVTSRLEWIMDNQSDEHDVTIKVYIGSADQQLLYVGIDKLLEVLHAQRVEVANKLDKMTGFLCEKMLDPREEGDL